MNRLSICIPVLNDPIDIHETVRSIRETAGDSVEIIVIDDGSTAPVELRDPKVILHRNTSRIGPGASRHLAVSRYATGDHVLLLDSHMRFECDWLEKLSGYIQRRPNAVWCGSCLGLNPDNMDVTAHRGVYYGASMCLWNQRNGDVFEGKWAPSRTGDEYELSCLMGACYVFPRQEFLRIGGMPNLRQWGSEEPFLSLKTWLSGGEIRLARQFRVGHKFRARAPYLTNMQWPAFNKIWAMRVTLDPDESSFLASKLPQDGNHQAAFSQIEQRRHLLDEERHKFLAIRKFDLRWFCRKFAIEHPLDNDASQTSRV